MTTNTALQTQTPARVSPSGTAMPLLSTTGSPETSGVLNLPVPVQPATAPVAANWQDGLPVVRGLRLTLRELRHEDAPALFAELTTEEVTRFISPPPTSVEGFERFIDWAQRRRAQGRYVCFAVVPEGQDTAVGMFQIHMPTETAETAEWGFVLGSGFWGRGLFLEGALLVLQFAFETLGLRRLQARACVANGRGNGALRKVRAVQEQVLEKAFTARDGQLLDQALWVIQPAQWHALIAPESTTIH